MKREKIKENLLSLENEFGVSLCSSGLGKIASNDKLIDMIEESNKADEFYKIIWDKFYIDKEDALVSFYSQLTEMASSSSINYESMLKYDIFQRAATLLQNDSISIESSDAERATILKGKALTVVPSIPELELEYNEEDVIYDKVVDFAYRLNLIGKEICLPDYPVPVKISEHTITESLHIMSQEHARLYDLPQLLPILQEVSQNAIKMQVEPYRHNNGKWAHIEGMHQYLSSFYNPETNVLYPVKITVQERVKGEEDSVYMTITVGRFDLEQIKKKDLSTLRSPGEPEKERSHGKSSLFVISLPELVSKFNNKTTIFIKNLPDELLSQEQIDLKRALIIKDIQKEGYEVDDSLTITKVTPSAIYPNENRIVIPYTVKGISPSAFDEIDVSNVNIFIKNKHETNLSEIVNSEKEAFLSVKTSLISQTQEISSKTVECDKDCKRAECVVQKTFENIRNLGERAKEKISHAFHR